MNKNDPILTLSESARMMGVSQVRARRILSRSLISPVRTTRGIGYRAADIADLKRLSG